MPDAFDGDDQYSIIHCVDDPIVANTNAISILAACKFPAAIGPRLISQ